MKVKSWICAGLVMVLLWGCTPGVTPDTSHNFTQSSPSTGLSTIPTAPAGTDTEQNDQEALFEQLFNLENKITVALHMTQTELAKMQADYTYYSSFHSKSPIYRMADLDITVGDTTYRIQQVGVRMKGNTSRTDFYSEEEGIYNMIHLKLSFQETFDDPVYYGDEALVWTQEARKERKDRTFATLEKLDMKWNKCDDSSYVKEYYAYEMYRGEGVLAPHTNLASVDWAGVHMGVYTIYEPIDKIFLEKNLPKEQQGGDLYKLGWTSTGASFTDLSSIGIEDEDAGAFYCYDLKTNKKTSTHQALTRLIQALNSGAVTKEGFAELVDMEQFLSYAAVSYLLGNPDDLRNNYNNCYLYFRGDTGQAIVIPYDYDRCLGVTKQWNPTGDGVTSDNPFSTTQASRYGAQRNPLFLYSVCAGGYYVREYAAELSRVAAGKWMDTDIFLATVAVAEQNYSGDTKPGKTMWNAADYSFAFDPHKTSDFASQGNISFREYVQAKLATMEEYLKNVDSYAAQKPEIVTALYLRADFTNWEIREEWELQPAERGRWSVRLELEGSARFKIYSQLRGSWYGSEVLTEETEADWSTDGHTNIVLEAGTYLVLFDPVNTAITVTAE